MPEPDRNAPRPPRTTARFAHDARAPGVRAGARRAGRRPHPAIKLANGFLAKTPRRGRDGVGHRAIREKSVALDRFRFVGRRRTVTADGGRRRARHGPPVRQRGGYPSRERGDIGSRTAAGAGPRHGDEPARIYPHRQDGLPSALQGGTARNPQAVRRARDARAGRCRSAAAARDAAHAAREKAARARGDDRAAQDGGFDAAQAIVSTMRARSSWTARA